MLVATILLSRSVLSRPNVWLGCGVLHLGMPWASPTTAPIICWRPWLRWLRPCLHSLLNRRNVLLGCGVLLHLVGMRWASLLVAALIIRWRAWLRCLRLCFHGLLSRLNVLLGCGVQLHLVSMLGATSCGSPYYMLAALTELFAAMQCSCACGLLRFESTRFEPTRFEPTLAHPTALELFPATRLPALCGSAFSGCMPMFRVPLDALAVGGQLVRRRYIPWSNANLVKC